MNKGQMIRSFIEQGNSDEQILAKVNTTINSIRWHRSKMKKSEYAMPATMTHASYGALSVGAALDKHGLVDEVRDCLERLFPAVADKVFARLQQWSFRTNGDANSRLGLCNYRKKTIEVHSKLMGLPGDLRQTFLHECAHAIDYMVHGRSSGHGTPWQIIMVQGFGLSHRARGGHSKEAQAAMLEHKKRRAYQVWECNGCGIEAPVMRKRKYPPESYRCRQCGSNFKVKQ